MPWWQWLADVAGLCLLFLLLYAVALLVRRRLLTRSGGTFEVSLRTRSDRPGRGWVLGVGRYAGDAIEVFRLFSLRMRPLRTRANATRVSQGATTARVSKPQASPLLLRSQWTSTGCSRSSPSAAKPFCS